MSYFTHGPLLRINILQFFLIHACTQDTFSHREHAHAHLNASAVLLLSGAFIVVYLQADESFLLRSSTSESAGAFFPLMQQQLERVYVLFNRTSLKGVKGGSYAHHMPVDGAFKNAVMYSFAMLNSYA